MSQIYLSSANALNLDNSKLLASAFKSNGVLGEADLIRTIFRKKLLFEKCFCLGDQSYSFNIFTAELTFPFYGGKRKTRSLPCIQQLIVMLIYDMGENLSLYLYVN